MNIVKTPLSLERALTAFAGGMVIISVLLTTFVHAGFIWFTVFIGANLFQQSFTGLCPATWVMKRLGLKSECELATLSRAQSAGDRA